VTYELAFLRHVLCVGAISDENSIARSEVATFPRLRLRIAWGFATADARLMVERLTPSASSITGDSCPFASYRRRAVSFRAPATHRFAGELLILPAWRGLSFRSFQLQRLSRTISNLVAAAFQRSLSAEADRAVSGGAEHAASTAT